MCRRNMVDLTRKSEPVYWHCYNLVTVKDVVQLVRNQVLPKPHFQNQSQHIFYVIGLEIESLKHLR